MVRCALLGRPWSSVEVRFEQHFGRMRTEGKVLLILGLLGSSVAAATVSPSFSDVSEENGLLKYEELDLRNADSNKYWGSTIADVNRDGVYDFWLSAHNNNPELYLSNTDGKYTYIDPKLYVRDLHATAAADMDNDGYLDLLINLGGRNGNRVNGYPLVQLSSTGTHSFDRDNCRASGLDDIPFRGRSVSFLDVNGDGCQDLLFVNRRNTTATYSHLIYENLCDGTFVFRNNTGMEEVDMGWHHIVDVNNDSLPDILFLWYTGVELWVGTGDFKFEDRTDLIPGASRMKDCRTAAEIDYNNDGNMDLLFIRGKPGQDLDDVLLENTGNGFVDVSVSSGIAIGGEHYHVTSGDLNNDGYTDLYISRAMYAKPRVDDLVLLNNGDKTFSPAGETGMEIAAIAPETDGDNANIFDYNNDGHADVLVGSRNSPWRLYENVTPSVTPDDDRHYILVRVGIPRAKVENAEWFTQKALGALVKVFCGDQIMMSRVGSPGQSHSQSYMDTLHFGLGSCDFIEKIEVHYWHNIVVTRTDVDVDQMVVIGSYFPCPEGMLGQNCDEQMKSCSSSECADGEICEVAELVGSRCDEERCSGLVEDDTPMNLLVNGGFESSSGWQLAGPAVYDNTFLYEGVQSMNLPEGYAFVEQEVELEAGVNYNLSCKVESGPVQFKVLLDENVVARDLIGDPGAAGIWTEKMMNFVASSNGIHVVRIITIRGVLARIDACTLLSVPMAPPAVTNLLVDASFEEGTGWEDSGDALSEENTAYEGSRSMSLPLPFSRVKQDVSLLAGVEYTLRCFESGPDPVLYRVMKGDVVLHRNFEAASEAGSTAPWKSKTLVFSVQESSSYEISLGTSNGSSSLVDACELTATEPAAERMDFQSREVECRETCLKVFCPI